MFTFNYEVIDKRYHARAVGEYLTLFKGAPRTDPKVAITSNAIKEDRLDHLEKLVRIIEQEDHDEIFRVINKHTSYYHYTPFLSATSTPEQAQVFAPTRIDQLKDYKSDSTIYQLRIKAERCIIDSYNTGGCHPAGEYLILGMIYPEEITAMKIVNDDLRSELYDGRVVNWFPKEGSKNTEVKDPTNWQVL